jgi:hypothetical protein
LEQAKDAVTRLMNKLEEIDFKGLIASLDETVNGIKRTVNSPELESTIRSLQKTAPKIDEAVLSIRDLAVTLNENSKNLAASLEQTSIDARASMKQADKALEQATETMKSAEAAVANIQTLSDPDAPIIYELGKSITKRGFRGGAVAAVAGQLPGSQPERPHLRKTRVEGELMYSWKAFRSILLILCLISAGCLSLDAKPDPLEVFRSGFFAAHRPESRECCCNQRACFGHRSGAVSGLSRPPADRHANISEPVCGH